MVQATLLPFKTTCCCFGVNETVTNDKEALAGSTHLILPGVSSFGDGMKGLTERGLVGFLKTVLSGQKDFWNLPRHAAFGHKRI